MHQGLGISGIPPSSSIRPAAAPAPPQPRVAQPRQQYLELRSQLHRKLLNRLNLEALAQTERARAENEIRALLSQLLAEENTPISLSERESLFAEVLDDLFGLGPLEPLLRDRSVNDILVKPARSVLSCGAASASGCRRRFRTTVSCCG